MHGHATQVIHLDKPKCTMLKNYAVSTLSGRLELQTSRPSLPWRSPCPCGYLSNCELGLTWPSASLPGPHAHEAEPDRTRHPPLLPWQTRLQPTVPRTERGPRLPPPCKIGSAALVTRDPSFIRPRLSTMKLCSTGYRYTNRNNLKTKHHPSEQNKSRAENQTIAQKSAPSKR